MYKLEIIVWPLIKILLIQINVITCNISCGNLFLKFIILYL